MAKKSLNKVLLSGNLGKDPVMRATQDGTPVATSTLAVNTTRGGEEETTWANLVAFGKTAELFRDYLHRGDGIIVVGRYNVRSYTQNDETKYSHEVIVEDITFLNKAGGAKSSADEDDGFTAPAPTPIAKQRKPSQAATIDPDEIPF